ncbi:NADH-ubiquinone oxidoreductase subunit 6 [Phenylobacterium sp. Root77]|uniref:NAD(P)/FAD-dependent oxidoreductase n=1 Tax=unclassified Phenylobacterium TaxID=2640670 RepID=UPI0006F4156B|nr:MULTISPECIES: FAD-dependent oxidoreductase [unclassified Phenylobacterium]KQW70866.1 NADH-ubiquinone oxidoreductase subunit 6 [Phenylobacterium sp. Root1277]KQW90713.1 NADH-ubiquinone oxidoreductase subunit 6 [Phenylobacterium sp. Root1290]KRC39655.1 NADH-ubiquinone oxidoreductase subunit 6 [Phenylobacterium sp. Root77]
MTSHPPLKVAVIGGGVAGLSAAWLLSQHHEVTLFEDEERLGGHANTIAVQAGGRPVAVDTGFIVYNEPNYPNFTALLEHLGVESRPADMALSVSLDDGEFEYSSGALFAQASNLFSLRYWAMLRDVTRFYREGPKDLAQLEAPLTSLEDYLEQRGYCQAFRDDHLLPQAAAIWSTPLRTIREYPAAALIRFFQNHGMMSVFGRGTWRTVSGGSQAYVGKLAAAFRGTLRLSSPVAMVRRDADGVEIRGADGRAERFDQVVIATHGDTALGLLADPDAEERRLLSAFRYSQNLAVLHTDASLMPVRRAAWTSWNHIGRRDDPTQGCVTYWMNRLQSLRCPQDLFVTLNPTREIALESILWADSYSHPQFDAGAIAAQRELWSLQGRRRTWFCGSYFGHGFHEDALQSGLAVAEALGGAQRPWSVEDESGRIHLNEQPQRRAG